jgi:DNA-binding NtrC family response regulator
MSDKPEKILVVDDEKNMLTLMTKVLCKEGYELTCVSTGEEALRHLETEWYDLIVSDLKLPGMDGLELLKKVKAIHPAVPYLVLTAFGSVDTAVAAMKEGAHDYLTKPVNIEEIKVVVRRALDLHHLTREVERLRDQVEIEKDFRSIISRSPRMHAIFRLIKKVAGSQSTVLIQGESGTGKELIARAIHSHSPRHEQPFVTVDCGALPETLLESELFGHVKGAFTGAIQSKKGLFEEAHGGTLLLDEIGDTTLAFQSKLMRVLQESEIRPVGSNKSILVDVRVIAATNKDLRERVKKKVFREDLYFRLAVVPMGIPPLRDRKEDIPLLAVHFVKKYCQQNGMELKTIPSSVLRVLYQYPWPGNVRELENVIERAVLVSPSLELEGTALFLDHVADEPRMSPLYTVSHTAIAQVERDQISEAIVKAQGNRSYAAKLLGISRATLYNKLRRYSLPS